MNNKKNIYILCYFIFIMFFSCKHKEGEYHNLNDKIEGKSIEYHGELSSEIFIDNVKTIEVNEGEHTFLIPERKSQIKSYACIECHTGLLYKLKGKSIKKAHWDVTMDHASSEAMNCITCHDENNMNVLNTITGSKIDFNKSYKLCAQCHSTQFEDWKGGAHGKKIAGWTPPRASLTCVNCHNPHSPGFKTRWPSRFNTQKVKERKEDLEH